MYMDIPDTIQTHICSRFKFCLDDAKRVQYSSAVRDSVHNRTTPDGVIAETERAFVPLYDISGLAPRRRGVLRESSIRSHRRRRRAELTV